MVTNKERTTVCLDKEVFERILKLRADREYARMSVSAIINKLLAEELGVSLDAGASENPAS